MARTSPFSSLFNLRERQITAAFADARHFASTNGIKILRAKDPMQMPAKVLIVPTRALKGHVFRNKVRRQIKALIYENDLAQRPGIFIILLYPAVKNMDFNQLKKFLLPALRKGL